MPAKIAATVALVLLAAAVQSGHVLEASANGARDSSGFGGSWTTTAAVAQAHLAALRTIERYTDPRTASRLQRVRCSGVPSGTASCFVAAATR